MSEKRVIWKFAVPMAESFLIQMPEGAEMLCVQMQRDEPQLWALVDPDAPKAPRNFTIMGTGKKYTKQSTKNLKYVGTFQSGTYVWHLFDGRLI
ncbi:MAG: hypothetical protein GTO24_21215 [candidate division Zixibacteria bacterium]|nr:hypothetical protein [candidate division Zixibacteria bacterium]